MATLIGRTAVVTGAGRGIGRAIARRLARDGARVAVHYGSSETAAKETVAAIEAEGGSAFPLRADLSTPDGPQQLWEAFDREADELHILVNNAGVSGNWSAIEELTAEDFDHIFAVNAKAPFFVTQAALGRLSEGGRIVNISSRVTRVVLEGRLIAYAASKGAVDVFTRTLANELGPRRITVNAVAPGATDTDMSAPYLDSAPEARSQAGALAALGRVGEPADIADVVAFLASDDARWITGQWIDTSGGVRL
ncbi:glucose 1-dehydrogenase [Streptomyces sp. YIM 98790]|uniref:glucose 1-dehydrogenase n=1 Tax=Streptomyces sp. YIM 98790 TaxID=2689077 RepID=UPI00140771B9|nr:glucose 1-dehydrogenase [Streptomyces sp. YIM 98790]